MTEKRRNHLLICLEENKYSRKVLLRGALLARKDGYTFEVVFFYSYENRKTMFHLLNIAESKSLSERLGAEKYTIKRTKNERETAQKLVMIAKNNNVKEIIMSGAQPETGLKSQLWRSFFSDKYNYIIKNIPNIVLVLINHREDNPFEKDAYENGRKGYLIKKDGKKPPII